MMIKRLETDIERALPVHSGEIDEVCISFYPTINLEFTGRQDYFKPPALLDGKQLKTHILQVLDEHELALAG